jgi:hypothetical protein
MNDGTVVYVGSTRRANGHNFQALATFVQRINPETGEKSCLASKNIPHLNSISFKED